METCFTKCILFTVASKLAAEADVSVVFVASFSEEGSDRESLSFDAGEENQCFELGQFKVI